MSVLKAMRMSVGVAQVYMRALKQQLFNNYNYIIISEE